MEEKQLPMDSTSSTSFSTSSSISSSSSPILNLSFCFDLLKFRSVTFLSGTIDQSILQHCQSESMSDSILPKSQITFLYDKFLSMFSKMNHRLSNETTEELLNIEIDYLIAQQAESFVLPQEKLERLVVLLVSRAYFYDSVLGKRSKSLEDCNYIIEHLSHVFYPNALAFCFYRRARILDLEKSQFQFAKEDLDKTIELIPDFAFSYNNRANIFKDKLEDNGKAQDDYNKAIELYPVDAQIFKNRALLLEQMGNFTGAIEDYNQSAKFDPHNSIIFQRRGWIYDTKLNKKTEALKDYSRAIELNSTDHSCYNNRGNIYKEFLHEKDKALVDYSEAIRIKPNESMYYRNRGQLYEEMKKFDLALNDFNMAIECAPTDPETYFKRAFFYEVNGKSAAALRDYNKAIELDTNAKNIIHLALNNRANIYRKTTLNLHQAFLDLNRALRIQKHKLFIQNFGLLYNSLGEPYFAKKVFTERLKIEFNFWTLCDRAKLQIDEGDFDSAMSDLQHIGI